MESNVDAFNVGDWQQRFEYKIVKTELHLQDLLVNMDDLTKLENASVFRVKKGNSVPFMYDHKLL